MPSPRPAPARAGFTLLELLLVLVVVGLIASLASLSVGAGSRPRQIDAALRHFAAVAEHALEEAQMGGVDLGLFIAGGGGDGPFRYSYQWLRRVPAGWEAPVDGGEIHQRRTLPRQLEVRLQVEQGNALRPPAELAAAAKAGEAPRPQAVFFSSGETTPGIMTWADRHTGETLWEVEWDLLGRFELRRGGEAGGRDDD